MLTIKELEVLKGIVEREEGILELREQYEEYKKLDTPRGKDKMEDAHVLDDYNEFMDNAEKVLFPEESLPIKAMIEDTIVIPKPSDALEAFKDKFSKFF